MKWEAKRDLREKRNDKLFLEDGSVPGSGPSRSKKMIGPKSVQEEWIVKKRLKANSEPLESQEEEKVLASDPVTVEHEDAVMNDEPEVVEEVKHPVTNSCKPLKESDQLNMEKKQH